jgi:hypothetical protein
MRFRPLASAVWPVLLSISIASWLILRSGQAGVLTDFPNAEHAQPAHLLGYLARPDGRDREVSAAYARPADPVPSVPFGSTSAVR